MCLHRCNVCSHRIQKMPRVPSSANSTQQAISMPTATSAFDLDCTRNKINISRRRGNGWWPLMHRLILILFLFLFFSSFSFWWNDATEERNHTSRWNHDCYFWLNRSGKSARLRVFGPCHTPNRQWTIMLFVCVWCCSFQLAFFTSMCGWVRVNNDG